MSQPPKRSKAPGRRSVLVLGLTALGSAALISRWALAPPAFDGPALTVGQAHAQAVQGSIHLIDIRRPDEWRRTGIGEGAVPIDMRRDDFIEALRQQTAATPDHPIALICARGVRSARMGKRLAEAGFGNIIDVPEGMLGSAAGPGWLGANLPTRSYGGDTG